MSQPNVLPVPTPENAISFTMQHQQQQIMVLGRIAAALEKIAIHTEKIANKSH